MASNMFIKRSFTVLKSLLAIIGLFAVMLTVTLYFQPYFMSDRGHNYKSSYDVQVRVHMRVLATQSSQFEQDNGKLPQTFKDLVGTYLPEEIRDPWGNEYKYELKNGKMLVYTYDMERSTDRHPVKLEYNPQWRVN